jgi:hypothetical protein
VGLHIEMPKRRQRICLEHGLKLDLNELVRQGCIRPGAKSDPHLIRWTKGYTGKEIASGLIIANVEGQGNGWLTILDTT